MGKGKKGGDLYSGKVTGLSDYQRESVRQSLRRRHVFSFPWAIRAYKKPGRDPCFPPPNVKFSRLSLLVSMVLWGEEILFAKKSRRQSFSLVILGTGGDMWLSGREGRRMG